MTEQSDIKTEVGASGGGWDHESVDPLPRGIPERISAFVLQGLLGSGGMGAVYLAIQDNPKRRVALKVQRRAMGSDADRRRFEFESQLMGRLRHPGIAQIYEAGTYDDGSGPAPFFAMEYIAAARILTEYAQWRHLALRQRIELFIDVCEAVHHGHLKGVIHRDLKPGNILVDSDGRVKIIDFGVARATGLDAATVQTSAGEIVGTIQYMSPEQCSGDPDDLDTRSDVYAMGLVLHQLLTDRLPYDVSSMSVTEALQAIHAIFLRPCADVDRRLPEDLRQIILKAISGDREDRYASAAAMGEDLRRFLDHLPVEARPPSLARRLRLVSRRNPLATFLTGGLAAVLLFSAVSVGILGLRAIRAERAEHAARLAAEAEMERTLRVHEFMLSSIMEQADPTAGVHREDATIAEVLDHAAEQVDVQFQDHPDLRGQVLRTVGRAYRELNHLDRAMPILQAAVEAEREREPPVPLDEATALIDLAQGHIYLRSYIAAEPLIRQVLEIRQQHDADGLLIAQALQFLGMTADRLGRSTEAMRYLTKAEGIVEPALSDAVMRNDLSSRREAATMLAAICSVQAKILRGRGDSSGAVARYQRGIDALRPVTQQPYPELTTMLNNQATVLRSMGDASLDQAEAALRESLAMKEAVLRSTHPSIANTLQQLGELLLNGRDDPEAARAAAEQALAIRRDAYERTPDDPRVLFSLNLLATVHERRSDHVAAEEVLRELIDRWPRAFGPSHPEAWRIAICQSRLGATLMEQGRIEEARPLLEGADVPLAARGGVEAKASADRLERLRSLP